MARLGATATPVMIDTRGRWFSSAPRVPPLTLRLARLDARHVRPWSPHGRTTLLGDAAHVMPPQRGLGGNSAFADARSLLTVLQSTNDVPAAVATYEREMVPRARRAVAESEESAQLFHFRNPIAVAARAAALRATSTWQRVGLALPIRGSRRIPAARNDP